MSGKVTTPAGNTVTQYDTATRRSVPSAADAKVWASTASATKVAVAADGSYTLKVVDHPGTLNVDYPAARDYKAGAPQAVSTTAAAHTQNIALKYGYTTTISGRVADRPPSGLTYRDGAIVTASVEGREVARTVSRTIEGNVGSYNSITFDHPGTFRITASFRGQSDIVEPPRITDATKPYSFLMN